MKNVLLVICAIAYGVFPAIVGFQTPFLLIALVSILLGLIYFVLHTKDWPVRIVPWLLACIAVSRVAGYCWLNTRQSPKVPVMDSEAWFYGGLAAACFSFMLYKWMRGQNETPASVNPNSA